MKYTLFNSDADAFVVFSNEDGDLTIGGDPDFVPWFQEQADDKFDYFGPDGYEPVVLEERPELLLAFLLRYTGNWTITPNPFKS